MIANAQADGPIAALLKAALTAQQGSRFEDARRLYGEVLMLAPNHFDAVHMQGVVHYQLGLLEDARRYLDRAAVLRPGAAAVRQNRELLATALEYAAVEREICGEVLPRLAPLCAPPGEFATWLEATTAVHYVVNSPEAGGEAGYLAQLRATCAPVPVQCWCRREEESAVAGWEALDAALGAHPRGGLFVVRSGPRTLAHWLDSAAPEHVALMLDADEPGQIIDRLREITLQGRRRAAVLFATAEAARSIDLPGLVLRKAAFGAAA
jgi:tetratricopeptide (TPR) repeat protein